MALRIERFVASRIAAHESDLAAGREPDPEKTARALAHYARTLMLVRDYVSELDKDLRIDEPAQPPRSLSELRDELRRHLERI